MTFSQTPAGSTACNPAGASVPVPGDGVEAPHAAPCRYPASPYCTCPCTCTTGVTS